MLTRRQMMKLTALSAAGAAVGSRAMVSPDYSLTIGSCSLEVAPRKFIRTTGYNGQVPGPLLRMRQEFPVTIDVTNQSADAEVVHWHGLFLRPEVDGAMEEGTPHIAPGSSARYVFTPEPAGLRWYHTHRMAGRDMKKGLYGGQFGVLWVEPRESSGRYDQEFFLTLHDWEGTMVPSDDGSMSATYSVATINGRTLGFGEPLRVKQGQRVMLHMVNASATEPHWLALAGHRLRVVALDGNAVPSPQKVEMIHLSPAERVSVEVVMDNPGVWVLGEVRRHIQEAGMGIAVEYAGSVGRPRWMQPQALVWDYLQFGGQALSSANLKVNVVPLSFESKFQGHGAMDRWMINGRSFSDTEKVALNKNERYRLVFKNKSVDDHPVHLHRHSFELKKIDGRETAGILKDTVLVKAKTEVEVEFVAEREGLSLFHCHQQDHMDMGFMMLFDCK